MSFAQPAVLADNFLADNFKVLPIAGSFAAEVVGLDLTRPAEATTIARISDALAQYGVLVFRDQADLTPRQHIEFSRCFGPLEIHVQKKFLLEDHPEILVVSNVIENGKPLGLVDAGRYWHSDLSYLAEPSLGSLLHLKERPSEGGDTLFGSLASSYEGLDPALKQKLQGLTAVHDYNARNKIQSAESKGLRPALSDEQAKTVPPVTHPVVRRHEGSGAPLLFVNEGFTTRIQELEAAESADLLALLFAHQKQERFQYRHQWKDGDMVFWDNRSTQHLATGTPPHLRRTLYRTTIRGPRPTAYVD
jgi:taurine dioxygenase